MALISFENVSVEFPIYTPRSRSVRRELARLVGGQVEVGIDGGLSVVRALQNVSLELKNGDRLGIIGDNGAGKSSLLRTMAGVYEPVRGKIDVEGRRSSLLDITLGIDSELSGYENIIMRSIIQGRTTREAKAAVDSIAEFTGLGQFLEFPVRTYSSGMQLRLAFAVSTAYQPDIILLDEMVGVGDAQFAAKAQERIVRMIDGASIMVLSSHDFTLLQRLCNRLVFMHRGEVVMLGGVDAVIARYVQHLDGTHPAGAPALSPAPSPAAVPA